MNFPSKRELSNRLEERKAGTMEVEQLLREISPDAPSGEDLEYDPVLLELDNSMEESSGMVPGVQEGKPPNWSDIQRLSVDLLRRSHDLRGAIHFACARIHTEGIQGLYDGLRLIHGLVEKYWDTLYPRLDSSNDPTERVNRLATLTDWKTVIDPLLRATLCSSRAAGSVNLRLYRIASGKTGDMIVTEKEREDAPTGGIIEAVFRDCDLENLRNKARIAHGSLEMLDALEAQLNEKLGPAGTPDLSTLRRIIKEMDVLLHEQLSKREPPGEPTPSGVGEATGDESPPRPLDSARRDTIESRKDVIRHLNLICAYYAKSEPSSPVPLLLQRAMRLAEMSFLEIMQDLAPDSLGQIRIVSGSKEDSS